MKAITFDFWSTLMTAGENYAEEVVPRRYEILLAASDEAGVPAGEAEVRDAWNQATRKYNDAWLAGLHMPLEDRVAYAFKLLGIRYDPELVARTARLLSQAARDADVVTLPGAREAIPELARHYKLAVVSDTSVSGGDVIRHYLDRAGLLPYFSAFSFSNETGVVKPNPRAFLAALDQLGLPPAEALHVGDIPRTDVGGAFDTGYPYAVLYTGHKEREGGPEPSARVGDHRQLLRQIELLEAG
ncbi:HAD family hydrolase [Oceanithermus sp.]|jgi:putative hydrolase of the HAD superfamily